MAAFRGLVAIFLSLVLAACGDKTYAWREQVLLQDGTRVLVDRTARFSENWVAGGGGGSVNKGMTLRVVQGPTLTLPPVWDDRFVPIVLELDASTGEWVIVATFFHCDSWYELGRPPLPYAEYRYRDGRWTRQALLKHWVGHSANVLVVDLTDKDVMTGREVLTIERKKAIDELSNALPEYKRVVDHWTTGC
ncbi:hypothetical protein SNE35_14715 [Paucibacter sp. R3-3]|uniref:DUF4136 domain-containing protein n=1 Tax=Roseateles agri TaxID=3098619 RepID=A0ABU5DKH8_9BURK|nr:hypothetical protein [Paucibacter sp. R3-3]MDY0745769.1 hypothetical protein [Paucibacter sp. R3-3]